MINELFPFLIYIFLYLFNSKRSLASLRSLKYAFSSIYINLKQTKNKKKALKKNIINIQKNK